MDTTITTMLAIIGVLILLAIDTGLKKDSLEKELDYTNKMVKRNCTCHPWKKLEAK